MFAHPSCTNGAQTLCSLFVLFLFFFLQNVLLSKGRRKAVPCLKHSQCLSRWNREQDWLSQILLRCLPLSPELWAVERRGGRVQIAAEGWFCVYPVMMQKTWENLSPPAFRVRFVMISQFRCPGTELMVKWFLSLSSASVPPLLYLHCSHHLWTIVFYFYHFYPRGVSTKN